jgi:hypothetical protein
VATVAQQIHLTEDAHERTPRILRSGISGVEKAIDKIELVKLPISFVGDVAVIRASADLIEQTLEIYEQCLSDGAKLDDTFFDEMLRETKSRSDEFVERLEAHPIGRAKLTGYE